MYRQRGAAGDIELAINAYKMATEQELVPPEAWKNLGYLYLKQKNMPEAQASFRQYLAADPEASDRAMIEFYLEEQ